MSCIKISVAPFRDESIQSSTKLSLDVLKERQLRRHFEYRSEAYVRNIYVRYGFCSLLPRLLQAKQLFVSSIFFVREQDCLFSKKKQPEMKLNNPLLLGLHMA